LLEFFTWKFAAVEAMIIKAGVKKHRFKGVYVVFRGLSFWGKGF